MPLLKQTAVSYWLVMSLAKPVPVCPAKTVDWEGEAEPPSGPLLSD